MYCTISPPPHTIDCICWFIVWAVEPAICDVYLAWSLNLVLLLVFLVLLVLFVIFRFFLFF